MPAALTPSRQENEVDGDGAACLPPLLPPPTLPAGYGVRRGSPGASRPRRWALPESRRSQTPPGSTNPPGAATGLRRLTRGRPQGSRPSQLRAGAERSPAYPVPVPVPARAAGLVPPAPAPAGPLERGGASGASGGRLPRIGGDPPLALPLPRPGSQLRPSSGAGKGRRAAGLRDEAGGGADSAGSDAGSRGGASRRAGRREAVRGARPPPPWRNWTRSHR